MLSPEQDVLYELSTLSGNINSINLGHRTLGFPVARTVKNLAAMKEARVRSLGWEDPLDEGMATHSSILAWRIP